jgi:hypothetical protein
MMEQFSWSLLQPAGFEYVDMFAPTAARPEASWDGLHYSIHTAGHYLRNVSKWQGGVSMMLTQILLTEVFRNHQLT